MNLNVKKIAAGAALLVVGIGIGASTGSQDETDTTAVVTAAEGSSRQKLAPLKATEATSVPTTAPAPTTTMTQAPTTTSTEAPTTTTTQPASKWVKVTTLTGQGDKNGPLYTLQGGQQRVTYSCSMPADGYVGASSFYPTGGFESFSCETEDGKPRASGSTMLYEESGTYHIEVNATPNNSWSITIEELR
jgi:hypothetical protein